MSLFNVCGGNNLNVRVRAFRKRPHKCGAAPESGAADAARMLGSIRPTAKRMLPGLHTHTQTERAK